jgi:transposase
MTIYCGVDFHARVQTVSYCDSDHGEIHTLDLHHQTDDLLGFYSQFKGEVVVGLEASGYSPWFEQMLEGLGHQVWLGDAAEIRRSAKRRQKNDRRDAELILDLLLKGEFPRLHRPSASSQEVLSQPRYRNRLVKIRTMTKNSLQALAIRAGLSAKTKLYSRAGKERLKALTMSQAASLQREHWLGLLKELDGRIIAIVAVGRKLLVRSYIMLRDNIDYAEFVNRGVEARLARH